MEVSIIDIKVAHADKEKWLTAFPVPNGVILGLTQGHCVKIENEDVEIRLSIQRSGFCGIRIDGDPDKAIHMFLEFALTTDLLPNYFHVHDLDLNKDELNSKYEGRLTIYERERLKYLYAETNPEYPKLRLPEGFTIRPIRTGDDQLLVDAGLEIYQRYWDDVDEMLENAFGDVIIDPDGQAAAVGYAAGIDHREVEVDLLAAPGYRGMGIGKFIGFYAYERCLKEGYIGSWDCLSSNEFSVHQAKTYNFKFIRSYKFISIEKHNQ